MKTPAPQNPQTENPPAFPTNESSESVNFPGARDVYASSGMTLRQYYKASALKGLLANPQIISCGQLKSEQHATNIVTLAGKFATMALEEDAKSP